MNNRTDGRLTSELRKVRLIKDFNKYADGCVLIELGMTKVLCTASIQTGVPPFLKGKGQGWITGEYGMLPSSTSKRSEREGVRGRPSGRTQEIQRLIGRSLRTVVDLSILGERTIIIDCDVLQADGGTRTASITGGFIALAQAIKKLIKTKVISKNPIREYVAATSVGIVNGEQLIDLNYEEDSNAEVDLNIVMTETGKFIEIQGTAEKEPFSVNELNSMLTLGGNGIKKLVAHQKKFLND